MRRNRLPTLELAEARDQGFLNIGEAAAASGVSAKMIRHYEKIGLIPKAGRTFANYRIYGETEVRTLQFVRRARKLGFSIPQIKRLVGLWQNQRRRSADIKRLAMEHVAELDGLIREMQAMRQALHHLAETCHGDDRPDCPILEDLATLHTGEAACEHPGQAGHAHQRLHGGHGH